MVGIISYRRPVYARQVNVVRQGNVDAGRSVVHQLGKVFQSLFVAHGVARNVAFGVGDGV